MSSGGTGAPPIDTRVSPSNASPCSSAWSSNSARWWGPSIPRGCAFANQTRGDRRVPPVHQRDFGARPEREVQRVEARDVGQWKRLQSCGLHGGRCHRLTHRRGRDRSLELAVAQIGHVVPMRRDRALGCTGRARRVEDGGVVLGNDEDIRKCRFGIQCCGFVVPRDGARCQVIGRPHGNHAGDVEALQFLLQALDSLASAMRMRGRQSRIGRRVPTPSTTRSKERRLLPTPDWPRTRTRTWKVPHRQRDSVTFAHTECAPTRCEAGDDAQVLGVGPALVAVAQERSVSEGRRAFQHLAKDCGAFAYTRRWHACHFDVCKCEPRVVVHEPIHDFTTRGAHSGLWQRQRRINGAPLRPVPLGSGARWRDSRDRERCSLHRFLLLGTPGDPPPAPRAEPVPVPCDACRHDEAFIRASLSEPLHQRAGVRWFDLAGVVSVVAKRTFDQGGGAPTDPDRDRVCRIGSTWISRKLG